MLGKNAEKELLANMEEIRYMTRSIVVKVQYLRNIWI